MNYIISCEDLFGIEGAAAEDPWAIEIRLDLLDGCTPDDLIMIRRTWKGRLLLTLRSTDEGGKFAGDSTEWRNRLAPLLPYADMIDIEERFSAHADWIRSEKKTIIASYHAKRMLGSEDLFTCERRLRSFGDIPKIVLAPESDEDAAALLQFLVHAEKPICLSIMGDSYSWLRPIFLIMGSHCAYCHAGDATATGQFHIREMREIHNLLMRTG